MSWIVLSTKLPRWQSALLGETKIDVDRRSRSDDCPKTFSGLSGFGY